jgi:membrane-bound lytic murein transglycosylase D
MEILKKYQLLVLFVIVFFLVGNTVYEKVTAQTKPLINLQKEPYRWNTPENANFCGEVAPLQEIEVKERLDRELLVNANFHSNTILIIKRANRWLPKVEKILKEENIPDDFKYLMVIESSIANAVSGSGAAGYWQLMKPTAKELGLQVNEEIDERYHVEKATRAACQYIRKCYLKFGSWTNTAAAYNMGLAGFMRACKKQKAKSYYDLWLNQETTRYVFRILAIKEIMQNPKQYGFDIGDSQVYQPFKLRSIAIDTSITSLIDFAHSQGVSYKSLKAYNAWLISDKLSIAAKTKNVLPISYVIELPIDAPFKKDENYLNLQIIPAEDSVKRDTTGGGQR